MASFPFVPAANAPFQFQPTLDSQTYVCTVPWNIFGQRWYLQCNALSGGLIFNVPLVGSPNDYPINLAAGYFTTSALVFNEASQTFVVTP